MELMHHFMKNNHSFEYVTSSQKHCLSGANQVIRNRVDADGCHFCEDFKAYIQQANGSELLDFACVVCFRQ